MIEVRCEECGHINEAGPSDPFQEAFAYAIDGDSELLRLYHTSSQFKVTLDTMLRALPSYVRSLAEQAKIDQKARMFSVENARSRPPRLHGHIVVEPPNLDELWSDG